MMINYLGHAAFLIITQNGTRIIMDPYNHLAYGDSFRYQAVEETAEIVTISHDHDDHNFKGIKGDPRYFEESGHWVIDSITIDGYESFHDDQQGRQRGKNIIFAVHCDDLSIVHLGDLGHHLSEDQIKQIGPVDILLIPVGGKYTIDASVAGAIVNLIKPKIVIPMHYLTDRCFFPIAPVDSFVKNREFKNFDCPINIDPAELPVTTICYVLNPTH